ncbi:hypothetical protein SAMN02745671_02273, partial [Anaerovibrio lipolyticus DSM 3074]
MADNSLEIRTRVRMAQWQSIIKECKESGMTVAEFCEDRNISSRLLLLAAKNQGIHYAVPNHRNRIRAVCIVAT